MRDADFHALSTRLRRLGIAPGHAHRAVDELRDHYADLVEDAVDAGASCSDARSLAAERLGAVDDFVAEMTSRRELKTWPYRYPHLAVVVFPLGCLVMLPAIPVFAGIANAATLARWGLSLLVAGLVTAAMMLVMWSSIILG